MRMNRRDVSLQKRSFSLWLYLLIVFGLSWPFQIVAAIWGIELLPRYVLHATSMCIVTVGTFIAGLPGSHWLSAVAVGSADNH